MPDIFVTVRRSNGQPVQVNLEIPEELYRRFQEVADREGRTIEDIFGEAIRLEKLFVDTKDSKDQSLVLRSGDKFRELEAV